MLVEVHIKLDCADVSERMIQNLETSLSVFMDDVFQVKNPACVREYSIRVAIPSKEDCPGRQTGANYPNTGTSGSD